MIIPINLVCVLFDPAIPTSSFDFIVFYTCYYTVAAAHAVLYIADSTWVCALESSI